MKIVVISGFKIFVRRLNIFIMVYCLDKDRQERVNLVSCNLTINNYCNNAVLVSYR